MQWTTARKQHDTTAFHKFTTSPLLCLPRIPCRRCRLAPDDGTGLAGMPALLLWGMRVPPQHLLLLLGAGLMFGWRGGVFAVLLYMWWRASSAGAAAGTAQQPPTQQRMAAAQDYFSRVLQQEPLGRGGAAPGEERRGAGADPWAARGKPRCLNDQ